MRSYFDFSKKYKNFTYYGRSHRLFEFRCNQNKDIHLVVEEGAMRNYYKYYSCPQNRPWVQLKEITNVYPDKLSETYLNLLLLKYSSL